MGEGGGNSRCRMWELSVHPGALKKNFKKAKVENYREVAKEVKSLANKLRKYFSPSLESAWRHRWNNFVALSLIYHLSVLTLECTIFNV